MKLDIVNMILLANKARIWQASLWTDEEVAEYRKTGEVSQGTAERIAERLGCSVNDLTLKEQKKRY